MTVTANPWESTGREMTVTLKEHKGFDAAWLVFKGSPDDIEHDIARTFGYESADVTGLALVDLVGKAKKDFQAGGLVATKLGGTPVPPSSEATSASKADGPPWHTDGDSSPAQGSSTTEEPVDPNTEHLTALEAIGDVEALKLYWHKHQKDFAGNDVLTTAYKARGKALTAAAK